MERRKPELGLILSRDTVPLNSYAVYFTYGERARPFPGSEVILSLEVW